MLVLGGQSLAAQATYRRLAVLEFSGRMLEEDVLGAFSDAVRGGAVEGLVGRDVKVMTRENMMVLLRDMGKSECSEGDCEVETARNIGADFVVSASVVHIENSFVITLKLHEAKEGGLLATDNIQANTQLEALNQLRQHGRDLVAKNIERLGDSAATPVGDTATAPAQPLIAAPAPEVAPVASGNKFHIGINFLPIALGKMAFSGSPSADLKFTYGVGILAGYEVLGLSVGIASQFLPGINCNDCTGDAAKEYDFMLRVAFAYTVMPKLAVYVEVLPGYSILAVPYADNPKGFVLAFGAGATFDITGQLFANLGIGYQRGYQATDGNNHYDDFCTKFLRIAVGLGMKF
jgi:TolB-like protein